MKLFTRAVKLLDKAAEEADFSARARLMREPLSEGGVTFSGTR